MQGVRLSKPVVASRAVARVLKWSPRMLCAVHNSSSQPRVSGVHGQASRVTEWARNFAFNDAGSCYEYVARVAVEWNGNDGKTEALGAKRVSLPLCTP